MKNDIQKLLFALNDYATDVDVHEFGLPFHEFAETNHFNNLEAIATKQVQKIVNKQLADFKKKVRIALTEYVRSEGCSCCRGHNHDEHANQLGELLGYQQYKDSTQYDLYSPIKTNNKSTSKKR